jgi:hypothetical protein
MSLIQHVMARNEAISPLASQWSRMFVRDDKQRIGCLSVFVKKHENKNILNLKEIDI